jgi:hypothetical protein
MSHQTDQPRATGATAAGSPLGAPDAGPAPDPTDRSLGALFSEITQDLSTLVRQEVALAKAELSQDARRAGKGAGMLGGAGVAGHMVLVFLSVALWQLLAAFMPSALGALIVALIWGAVAAVLALKGRDEVQKVKGLPKTQDTVKKIPNALKGNEEENR